MGIGDLFAPKLATVSAQDVFTDRMDEQEAFDAAVANHLADVALLGSGGWSSQDLDRPRRNVLSYYGVGGIGKSTLLDRLADRLEKAIRQPAHWGPPPQLSVAPIVVRFDMRHGDTRGIEQLLITIRAELSFHGFRTTAFDLYLALYWVDNHPNEPLNEFAQRSGALRRAVRRLGLQEHVESAVGDVVGVLTGASTAGMSAVRLATELGRQVAERRLRKTALSECALLESLLDAPKDEESLSYSPYLLAWDLERIQSAAPRLIIVFIDTFEEASPATSALLERVVWLLPNVLFVVAGRNRLAWDGDAGGVPVITGRTLNWSSLDHLATEEPRQHLVGNLSDVDARSYLLASLGTAIDLQSVDSIVVSSGGYPLHLDLSVQRFRQIAVSRPPKAADFVATFSQLASRVLRDLSPDERHALLACCLFDAFDVDLIRDTLGLRHSGPIEMLFEKPLVQANPCQLYRWSIHRTLRQTLLTSEDLGVDQWTRADWRRIARQAMDVLNSHIATADTQRREFLALQLFQIAWTFGIADNQLPRVAISLTGGGSVKLDWDPKLLPGLREPEAPESPWLSPLCRGTGVVMQRQRIPREEVNRRLSALAECAPSFSELDILRYYQAEAARDMGDIEQSMQLLARIRATDGPLRLQAIHGTAHLLRRLGRFRDVAELLNTNSEQLVHVHRLRGDLAWTQGQLVKAEEHYEMAVNAGTSSGSVSEQVTSLASIAFVRAWLNPGSVPEVVEGVRATLGSRFHSFSHSLCDVAQLLASVENHDLSEQIYAHIRFETARLQQLSLLAYAGLARAFSGAVRGDKDLILSARRDLIDKCGQNGQFDYLVEVIDTWTGGEVDTPRAQWIDPEALSRWKELPAQRRNLDWPVTASSH
ncbi:hypothetical protein [Mycobacterium sp. M26]|uniref:hypothetical protein n=1 Tax=Mycobacterium sp. M26 TaxID=1762962 RepID=UPI000AF297A3|nr:hypothetical protein [Mycobacterium sp. M26]